MNALHTSCLIKKISNMKDILATVLEKIAQVRNRPLLVIIAEDIDGEASSYSWL